MVCHGPLVTDPDSQMELHSFTGTLTKDLHIVWCGVLCSVCSVCAVCVQCVQCVCSACAVCVVT